MNINQKNSKLIYKLETHFHKSNLTGSEYLIIKRECKNAPLGLFAYYITNLAWIEYALRNDYIPVIDMKNYANTFHMQGEVGKINTYEYYFEQPCSISVDEALKSSKARYIWKDIPDFHPNESLDFLYHEEIVNYYHRLASKYAVFSPNAKKFLNKVKNDVFGQCSSNDRILGVLARGTDYTTLKPYYHPIQPDVNAIIQKVNEYREKYNCSKIYVATEDAGILERLKKEYGNNLLYTNQKRIAATNTFLNFNKEFTSRTPEERGLDNLASIYCLSLCNGIVVGRTSGTVGAVLLAERYEFKYIFSTGRYGVEDMIIENKLV